MHTGWICPKCGKVYSPSVNECSACNEGAKEKKAAYPEPFRVGPFPWQMEDSARPFGPPLVWYSYTGK